jgi:Ca2+-binding RTX toxin-like protein
MAARVDWLGLFDAVAPSARTHAQSDEDAADTTAQGPALIRPGGFESLPGFVSTLGGDGAAPADAPVAFRASQPGLMVAGVTPSDVHGIALSDEVAFISGVYPDGTQPLYAFSAWNPDTIPADYSGGFTNSHKWGAQTANTPGGTVSYFFNASSNWSQTEKNFFVAGLSLWSDVTNISFTPAASQGSAQIVFTRGSTGNAATSPQMTDNGLANAGETGSTVLLQLTKATITIDTTTPNTGFGPLQDFGTYGGYPIMTFLHEEGHAIGLGHAGPYNGSVNEATQQFSPYDTRLWSIMSYIEPRTSSAAYFSQYPVQGSNWGFSADGHHNDPTGLMPLDIIAAQALYGAPASTPLSGGQTFGFHSNVSGPSGIFFDFTQNTNPVLTLWDAGTNNTLDISGWSTPSTVNLNPGTFSSMDGMTDNLAIAFGTAIDLFVGGGGSDTVTGNNDGDTFTGGSGNDTFTGGTGTDTVVFSGNFSDYTITDLGGGSFRIADNRAGSPDGTDVTNAIEQGKFADGTRTLGATGNVPAVLHSGAFAIYENTTTPAGSNVFADNGFGAASDPDSPLVVTAVNGSAGNVGHQITLASGAHLTVNGDGTFLYDPSHVFDYLPDPGSGASNTQAADSFTYSDGSVSASIALTITGVDSNDTLIGTSGNDTLEGGIGNDTINGGAGYDAASYAHAPSGVNVDLSIAGAQNTGGAGVDTLVNIEYLIGSSFGDTLKGDGVHNVYLAGGAGNDVLQGGSGSDYLDGGAGFDTASYANATAGVNVDLSIAGDQNTGGAGTDTLVNIEYLVGSSFSDALRGDGVRNVLLVGGGGNDLLQGGSGNDYLDGGTGLDAASYANATAGVNVDLSITVDQNTVGAGVDTLVNIEYLVGSAFGDTLKGDGVHNTYLAGGAGNDLLQGGAGNDYLDGGAGYDAASYANAASGVTVDLSIQGDQNTGGAGVDTLVNIEYLIGSPFDDVLKGNGVTGVYLAGGGGNDALYSGAGDDYLVGGPGNDTFVFHHGNGHGDIVADFTHGSDIVDLIGYGVTTFSDLQGHMSQMGADTLISFDASNAITLQDVQMTQLTAGDFLFS